MPPADGTSGAPDAPERSPWADFDHRTRILRLKPVESGGFKDGLQPPRYETHRRLVSVGHDLHAESTGRFFGAGCKHHWLSVQHSVIGHGTILDITRWRLGQGRCGSTCSGRWDGVPPVRFPRTFHILLHYRLVPGP